LPRDTVKRKKRSGTVAFWMLLAAGLAAAGVWLHLKSTKTTETSRDGSSLRPPRDGSGVRLSPPTNRPTAFSNAPQVVAITHPLATNTSQRIAPRETRRFTADTNEISAQKTFPRPPQTAFEMQVALARMALSPGSVDGQLGSQTRSALKAYQKRQELPVTGDLDAATRAVLQLTEAPTKPYVVSSNDLARLQPLSTSWLGKSQQTALDYETILEYLSEKAKSTPNLVRRLNPKLKWSAIEPCQTVELPNIVYPQVTSRAAFLSIGLGDKILEAWDSQTNLLAHFPCSIARQVEKRPVGELHVAVIAPNPNYTFDPEIFPESAEAKQLGTKLVLPPGPNNPVGVAWIGLDKPGYGIHGTPSPEQVGRTESHGCFRLANWNAEYLLRLVEVGTPVFVRP
jgi:lipoprotein-anchoring transpeptidase ErfK/SrfK